MKFVADAMLGRLAKWLRILGYDTTNLPASDAGSLLKVAREEKRVILTRNHRLPPESRNFRILLIESDHWREQLAQVLKAFRLRPGQGRFRRCILCNQRLAPLEKEKAEGKVPDFVFVQNASFFRCPRCGRIFWQGSHPSSMTKILSELPSTPIHSRQEKGH
jgi:uncharacterized protein